ncbi:bifunctional Polyphosphoinositide phosphatase Fig4-like/SAC domain [Babesia duncani]|uniref:Bifunctional Polyphosphoinositide phosphatase Fig4-like/SAC domain n=1 Tax=Babesia duncani TaxID=323732 RepID=A0AAD9UPF2_9APIC|nr:bifunctional Polyphosphoinositide phosphatase Fig4-like/SAC domain [Babesia duncani]KAK2196827.1 bifunctional Polyphosphoinositide phosphatase Fig4-like/SAC domain [Babesia duncani]
MMDRNMNNTRMIYNVYDSDTKVIVTLNGKKIEFYKNSSKINISEDVNGTIEGALISQCFGILGAIEFLSGPYLIVVTDVKQVGKLFQKHCVHAILGKRLIPLFNTRYGVGEETDYVNLFDQFDTSGMFYSDTYNLARSLQQNEGDETLYKVEPKLLSFDESYCNDKYRYNKTHVDKLCQIYGYHAASLCMRIIYGFYGQANVCLSGRNLILAIISRRSRFYAGTRYRKRGITAQGHVANDVETEQILIDPDMTNSEMSYVQIRGSTPIFWSQDTSAGILTKPPITYPQVDVGFTALRRHVKDLMYLYGSPLVFLNLLNSVPGTEEGVLCSKYAHAMSAINAELPDPLKTQYLSRNIRKALELGEVRQMIEGILLVSEENNMFHRCGTNIISVQTGVIRTSCLDCLDRTSAVAMHLGSFVLRKQLERLGITVEEPNNIYGTTLSGLVDEPNDHSSQYDPLLQVARELYQQMGDEIAMQYAGSRALRKYEGSGGALKRSLALFTQIQRRYHSQFADAERQARFNVFLGLVEPRLLNWDIREYDSCLHYTKLMPQFDVVYWWVLPMILQIKKHWLNVADWNKPWMKMFDRDGEYIPWKLQIEKMKTQGAGYIQKASESDADTEASSYILLDTLEIGSIDYTCMASETRQYGKTVRAMQLGFSETIQYTPMVSTSDKYTRYTPVEIQDPLSLSMELYLKPWNIKPSPLKPIECNKHLLESFYKTSAWNRL